MSGASLTNHLGPGLDAAGMTVVGGAVLSGGFVAFGHGDGGAVRLLGAHVTGNLNLSDATITNETGPAFSADDVTVGGNAYLNGTFNAHADEGGVRLLGAHISGQLDMSDATLTNEIGPALTADFLTVGRLTTLNGGFTATGQGELGAVRLLGARFTGQLNMSDATLSNGAGPALQAETMTVHGDAFFNGEFTAAGRGEFGAVDLGGAHISGQLLVDEASIERAIAGASWTVDGLTYDGYPDVGFDSWLQLLQSGTPEYRPQPYRQLAAAARAAGHDNDARKALMAQRDDQVKRGDLTSAAKAWSRFTKFALGYGYQPWRALIGIAMVLFAALTITFFVPGALAHDGGAGCSSAETFQIAVDMAIPLVSISTGSPCHVTSAPGGQFVAWTGAFLTFSGWALTALFAAGFTRAIRQP